MFGEPKQLEYTQCFNGEYEKEFAKCKFERKYYKYENSLQICFIAIRLQSVGL